MIRCGKLQQKPAKQKPDRQATHVAEKDLRHRPVERRETGSRAKQGGRDDGGQRSERTEKAKHQNRASHRYDFRDGHPVDPVHEIDQVDEPYATEKKAGAFDRPRQLRDDFQLGRERRDHGADGDALHRQPRRGRQGAHVVHDADQCEQRGCRSQRQELAALVL